MKIRNINNLAKNAQYNIYGAYKIKSFYLRELSIFKKI